MKMVAPLEERSRQLTTPSQPGFSLLVLSDGAVAFRRVEGVADMTEARSLGPGEAESAGGPGDCRGTAFHCSTGS